MTMGRAAFAALLIAIQPALDASAQSTVPLPRPKPAGGIAAIVAVPLLVPVPRPKPGRQGRAASRPATKPWPKDTGRWPAAEVREARAHCISILSSRDLIWRPDQPIGAPGGCGTAAPIAVAEVSGVRINPPATVNCDFAAALDDWVEETLQPASRKAQGARIIEITNASSYACRRRNNAGSGKLSEHAKANALDIASFVFSDKREITVKGQSIGLFQTISFSRGSGFLKTARKDACKYFNTVLGPGTDAFHKDHMHLDLMKLRPGRFKMCR
jgi:hypothetical protein